MPITVRHLTDADDLSGWFDQHWGGDTMVADGRVYQAADLSGLVAERAGTVGGVLTWVVEGDTMVFVSLDASQRREGIGSRLVAEALDIARGAGLKRIVLTTTNDNCSALMFWQRLGFRLTALRPNAMSGARRLKPTIPQYGENGLPIRDELDLELALD